MRTLLMVLQYPPDVNSTGLLMAQVAEGLKAKGHQLSIITSFPHYEHFRVRDEYRGKWLQRTHENDMDVLRVNVFANGKKHNMNYRLLSYLSFNGQAALANLLRREQYDAILCTNGSFFTGVAAYASGHVKGTPFIYNIQDLYPETPVAQGQLTNRRAIQGLERIEHFMYRKARHITVITPAFRENLVHKKHVPPEKISVVPNLVDTDFIRPLPKANPLCESLGLTDKIVITHAGNLGMVYDLETLVDAAGKLRGERDLVFLIVGNGVARAKLETRARELKLDNVRFMDFLPYADLPYLRAASDIQVSLYRFGAARYSMPSKIYEIMASARPVLASAEASSDVARLIAETRAGICIEPQSADALADAILSMARNEAWREEMGQRGRIAAEARFSKQAIVNQYDALLRRVAAKEIPFRNPN